MNYELKDTEHKGPIPAQRICWEDGSWWDVLTDIPYGVQSKIRALAAGAVSFVDGKLSLDNSDASRMMQVMEDANMLRLVGCSVAWSFPGKPDRNSIEMMPRRYVDDVLRVFKDMSDGSVISSAEKKTSPSTSSTESLLGVDGREQVTI